MRGRFDGTISVIIPTWNRATTIEKAVRSALAQTVSPREVLICDDGSSDNTDHIVDSIDDERIRWMPYSRGGRPAIPRNHGIRESKGEWIAFLDSDDEWLPDKLEKQLGLAQRLGCRAACSNAIRSIPGAGSRCNYLSWNKERITFANLLRENLVICSSVIVHRSLFAKVVGFPEDEHLTACEDYALWLRIATQTDFAYYPEPLVVYYDDAASSIRSEQPSARKQRRSVLDDFRNWGSKQGISSAFFLRVYGQTLDDAVRTMLHRS